MERKVGARGLRMILEDLMLDLMYYLPTTRRCKEFVVTKEMVQNAEDQSGRAGKSRLSCGRSSPRSAFRSRDLSAYAELTASRNQHASPIDSLQSLEV